MKDRNHKISWKLVNKLDLIGLENLRAKEMTKRKENKKRKVNRSLAKSIIRASWYQQSLFTSYKAKEAGKEVVFVNPKIERDVEIYNCSCGLVLDRDVNASKNIQRLETFSCQRI